MTPEPGTTLGSYQILSPLGAGGMGQVFRARDVTLQRDVALKFLPGDVACDAARRARLVSEARAAAALNHPGIATIYDIDETGPSPFIVMELVEGETLRTLASKGPVRPKTVARYAVQIADALAAAHQQRIVHGDVKPENAMVQPDDRVKLQDRLAESVGRALGSASDDTSPAEPPTDNARAYELYLRAMERVSRPNQWDTRTAIEMLKQVTKMAPEFAEAWSSLAGACLHMANTFEPKPQWHRTAERAMERALAIDPENAEAPAARGRVLWSQPKGYQHRPALKALGAALRLDPRSRQALTWRGLILLHLGLYDESLESLSEALASGPDAITRSTPLPPSTRGSASPRSEAIEQLRRTAADGFPNYPLFRDDPHFEPLRDDAEYRALLAALKAEWEAFTREFGRGGGRRAG